MEQETAGKGAGQGGHRDTAGLIQGLANTVGGGLSLDPVGNTLLIGETWSQMLVLTPPWTAEMNREPS